MFQLKFNYETFTRAQRRYMKASGWYQSTTPWRSMLRSVSDDIMAHVYDQAPKGEGHGSSLGLSLVLGQGKTAELRGSDIAWYQIRGTKPHEIKVNPPKQSLHFQAKGGDDVMVHSVWHPGIKPNPFVERGLREAMPTIESTVFASGRNLLGILIDDNYIPAETDIATAALAGFGE